MTVCSAVLNPHARRLVVGRITTSKSILLYISIHLFFLILDIVLLLLSFHSIYSSLSETQLNCLDLNILYLIILLNLYFTKLVDL